MNCSRAKSEPPLSTTPAQARDPGERFAYGSGMQQNQYRFGFGALGASVAHAVKRVLISEQANTKFKSSPNHGTPGAGALRKTKYFVAHAIAVAAECVCGCLFSLSCARGSLNLRRDLEGGLSFSSLLLRGLLARKKQTENLFSCGCRAGLCHPNLYPTTNSEWCSRNYALSPKVFTS